MAKRGSGEELVERGNGAEGLAPPAANYSQDKLCVGLAHRAARGLLLRWPPVQMEGRAGQCQLVSRIKTTHLFTEVSCKATRPKRGEAKGGEAGRAVASWGQLECERGSSLALGPPPSSSLSPAFLPVTYLSGAARSHYCSVRKAAGGVASPRARVTDCCSALAAEEVRGWKVIGFNGQEVGTEGWRKRWRRRAERRGEDDKTWLRDLWLNTDARPRRGNPNGDFSTCPGPH
ncbi:unnamed protein product [Pleuronectes platessa]|uniref:Uncharacterized protein n=1 Tax=Pleuronectes platessa TaxID=8262 RepID=A0A9N7YNI7_PLEPL|nr:unnamed protein product [Pleuronectes platessa]